MPKKLSDFEFVKIQPSHKEKKKWDAVFINKKTKKIKYISFGQKGYLDFPLYYKYFMEKEGMNKKQALEAAKRKRGHYLERHKDEDYYNVENWWRPSFWAANLLWGDLPDVEKQLKIIRRRYNF
jgi:hypothetical protein